MAEKKIPLRKCTGCNEMKPKKELVRVVKGPDGDISLSGDLFTLESLIIFIAVVALAVVGAGLVFACARRLADTETRFYGSVQSALFSPRSETQARLPRTTTPRTALNSGSASFLRFCLPI